MKAPNRIKHFRIQSLPGGQYGIGPRKFSRIEDLVEHYMNSHIYTSEEGTRMYLQRAFQKYWEDWESACATHGATMGLLICLLTSPAACAWYKVCYVRRWPLSAPYWFWPCCFYKYCLCLTSSQIVLYLSFITNRFLFWLSPPWNQEILKNSAVSMKIPQMMYVARQGARYCTTNYLL